jgi:cytochrome b561
VTDRPAGDPPRARPVPLRNGPHGYGLVTRALHWTTVVVVTAQLLVGYLMDADDSGRGRGRGRGGDSGRGRGRGGEEEYAVLDDAAVTTHVALGLTLLALALVRIWWRRAGGLPPWSERLSPAQRTWLGRSERGLLLALVLAPVTGLVLVGTGEDDLVWLHVAAHLLLYASLALHVGLVLGRGLLPRMLRTQLRTAQPRTTQRP